MRKLTAEQNARIHRILREWHESAREYFTKTYSNLDYDSPTYHKYYRVRCKYVNLDQGGSGYYMLEIETGNIYAIKAYGVPNKNKIVGNAWEPSFDGATLNQMRGVYGNYDLR